MLILDLFTKRDKKIILSSERWNHLVLGHPEMSAYLEEFPAILQNPDVIVQSTIDHNTVLYHKYYKVTNTFIVIVVNEEKSVIITAYTTDAIKRGIILWEKK